MNIFRILLALVIAVGGTGLLVLFQVMRFRKLSRHPWKDVFSHKRTLVIYVILRVLAIFALTRAILLGELESAGCCILALVLLEVPLMVERRLQIELSPTMEVIILLFIYAAEILGEVENYYVRVPGWDTALHTMNGFLCAAVGFCLVDMLNRNQNVEFHMSPLFLAIVAFCFSMTVGVLWEFLEYFGDTFFAVDIQKDFLTQSFHSVTLDPTLSNIPIAVKDIIRTTIDCADGSSVVIDGGYLDIGIRDTMKDLFVNCIGALVFSTIGYFGAKRGRQSRLGRAFIPLVKRPMDLLTESEES